MADNQSTLTSLASQLPPWPVTVAAAGGGVAVASGLATVVDWALGGAIQGVFLVLGGLGALVAVSSGGYALRVMEASLGPAAHGLAVGAIAVGFVHLGAFVIVPFILAFLFAWPPCPDLSWCCCTCEGCDTDCDTCCPSGSGCGEGSCCGSTSGSGGGPCGGGSSSGGSGGGGGCGCIARPGVAALLGVGAMPADLRNAFAHHPDHPAFAEDVFHVAGLRLCIGCTVTFPVFLAVAVLLVTGIVSIAWWAALGVGGMLTSAQAVSAAGLTSTKRRKVLVKLALGVGTAGLLHGVRASPWPEPAQAMVLLGLLGLVLLSTVPRSRRLAAWEDRQPART